MTIRFDIVGTCTGVATYRVEGCSPAGGLAHGSLDVDIAACLDCHETVRSQLIECGMTPYSVGAASDIRPCGERTVFAENSYTAKYPS